MIKLIDVAEYAGVSEATASLVMNSRPGVSENTRKKVLAAARELGYTPNSIAQGLATQKSNTIGLVVTDIENPFFGSVTRYIDENIRREGYNLILSVSNDDIQLENKIIKEFIHKRVDGVIVIPCSMLRDDFTQFEELEQHGIPYVLSTTYYPGLKADCVMTDLKQGSYQLTNYLLDMGHRKILFLVSKDSDELISSKLRIEGYHQAFKEKDLDYETEWIIECKKNNFYHGYKEIKNKLVEIKNIDTVIAINDVMALGALKAIKEAKINIPEEISVAGYDDVIFSSISETPLTTVKQNISHICQETVSVLLDKIQGKSLTGNLQLIKPELIIRRSTGVCN